MKTSYICTLLICIVTTLYIVNTQTPLPNNNVLTVGIAAGYAPYISINAQGEYEGFDIDVAHALAQQTGKVLVFKDLGSMTPLMIALDQGSIDMIIWGLTITPSRIKKFAMVHYQGANSTTNPLTFWKIAPDGVTSLADMQGKTICVEPCSFQTDIITVYPDIIVLPTEKVDDALLNIQYGKADAALLDPEIAKKFQTAHSEITNIEIPLPPSVQAQGMGIAIKKENIAMINTVATAIEQLKANGTLTRYEKKWNLQ